VVLVGAILSGSAARAEIVDRIVAVVDREVITLSEAEQAGEFRMLQGGREELPLGQIVDRLIEVRLVEREVSRYPDEAVAPQEVEQALDAIRGSFSSPAAFAEALAVRGMTEEELQVLITKQMRVERYIESRFRPLVYVTEDAVGRYYDEELLPELEEAGEAAPTLGSVAGRIRRILEEQAFNQRVDEWIESLKSRAHIRRYVW
jgi:peptidyl-prolyl cis-trans isomerase SurA